MSIRAQIQAARGAHEIWKARLATAIAAGASPFSPDEIRRDDRCPFGEWLHHGLDIHELPHAAEVRTLHAAFHGAAARILELAISGRRDEALAAMSPGSAFATLCDQLTGELQRWAAEQSAGPRLDFEEPHS